MIDCLTYRVEQSFFYPFIDVISCAYSAVNSFYRFCYDLLYLRIIFAIGKEKNSK